METNAAFVGTDGVVELHAVTEIHVHIAVVIDPWHAKGQNAVGFHEAFHQTHFLKFGMFVIDVLHGGEHLLHGLKKFRFVGMTFLQILQNDFFFHAIV